jgi:hypothetical protein
MIVLLPYRKMQINTTLSIDDAMLLLSRRIDKKTEIADQSFFSRRPINIGHFEGTITTSGFQIRRMRSYRQSFEPILYGHFQHQSNGVRVNLTIAMNPIVAIVSILYLCFILFLLINTLQYQSPREAVVVEAGIMGFFLTPFSAMAFIGFLDANADMRFVENVFGAYRIKE